MRVWVVLLLLAALCACCCGKKMWGARSKRDTDQNQQQKKSFETKVRPTKSKKSRVDTMATTVTGESLGEFGDIDNLFAKMDNVLAQVVDFLQSGKLQEALQSEAAQEWLNTLKSVEDPNVSQILEGMDFDDHDQLAQQLLVSIEQLRSQKLELRELFSNPSLINNLLSEIPQEYQSLIQPLLSGDVETFKNNLLSSSGLDSELKGMIEKALEGNFDFAKETMDNMFTDEQIETTRQELISNPELLEMLQIPEEVLKNPLLFSQFMKSSMNTLSDEMIPKQRTKSKVRAL